VIFSGSYHCQLLTGLHFCDIFTHLFVLAYLLRDEVGWSIFGQLWAAYIAFGILVGTEKYF